MISPQKACMCFVLISELKTIILVYSTKTRFFLRSNCIYCALRSEPFNTIQVSPSYQDPAMAQAVNRRPVTVNSVIRS